MGPKEAFRKVGQAIEETKMKIGMKKYKKGGIQIEEKDQKPEMVIPVNDISLPEEKRKQKMQKSEKSKIFQHMKTENSILRLKCRLNRRKWKK